VNPHHSILIYADNNSAVQTIAQASPGTSQGESRRFLEWAFEFLDKDTRNSISVEWVPGHHGIEGNEQADKEAKAACNELPTAPKTTLSHYYRTLKANFEKQWRTTWANHPRRGRYAIADTIEPSTKGSHAFRALDRKTLGLVTQARTGHGFYGAYYEDFNIPEPHECPCGAQRQTRTHILLDCPIHDQYRYILAEAAPNWSLGTILGTKGGIFALALFLRRSSAFRKPPPLQNPNPRNVARPPSR
jgi:hypothetical protein